MRIKKVAATNSVSDSHLNSTEDFSNKNIHPFALSDINHHLSCLNAKSSSFTHNRLHSLDRQDPISKIPSKDVFSICKHSPLSHLTSINCSCSRSSMIRQCSRDLAFLNHIAYSLFGPLLVKPGKLVCLNQQQLKQIEKQMQFHRKGMLLFILYCTLFYNFKLILKIILKGTAQ